MEELERTLPIINLVEGTDFYVDAFKGQLIDTKDKSNIIHELEMLPFEDHFEMLLDKSTRCLKKRDWTECYNDRYEYVWIRRLEVYDLEGAKQSATDEQLLNFKTLPVIDITGVKFLWDREQTLLRQQDNPWNVVYNNDIWLRGGAEGFYFDKERNVVPFPHELPPAKEELPSNIMFIPVTLLNEKIKLAEQGKISKVATPIESKKQRLGR